MRIGFYAPEVEFANCILGELKAKFVNDIWTRWRQLNHPRANRAIKRQWSRSNLIILLTARRAI